MKNEELDSELVELVYKELDKERQIENIGKSDLRNREIKTLLAATGIQLSAICERWVSPHDPLKIGITRQGFKWSLGRHPEDTMIQFREILDQIMDEKGKTF